MALCNYYVLLWWFSLQDFSNPKPPVSCGYDEQSGEDKFCCSDVDENSVLVKNPQEPLFRDKKTGKAYPCMDQTPHCERWVRMNPKSCRPDHKNQNGFTSYPFMREVCQASCHKHKKEHFRTNKCEKVIYFIPELLK